MNDLFETLVSLMEESIKNHPDIEGRIEYDPEDCLWAIFTQTSEDPRMSTSGGMYTYWTTVEISEGGILLQDSTSCALPMRSRTDRLFDVDVHDLKDLLDQAYEQALKNLERERELVE